MTLKEFRQSKKLSQEKFAQSVGYTLSMYAKVENGNVQPSTTFIKKVKSIYPKIDVNNVFFNEK